VERYSFDSVLALVLQGLALGMTNETKTGRTPGTRSDAMMKRVLNDALDRALGIGLQYDPGEIVVRRVGGRDDGGLAAGVHVLDVISKGMVEGPMRGRREDGEDATEGDGDEYGSSGTRREKGKEKGNASAIASAESRVQKASKTGRSGSSSRLTSREGEIRRRAWWSIVILDQCVGVLFLVVRILIGLSNELLSPQNIRFPHGCAPSCHAWFIQHVSAIYERERGSSPGSSSATLYILTFVHPTTTGSTSSSLFLFIVIAQCLVRGLWRRASGDEV
jgi:hypothetical protein